VSNTSRPEIETALDVRSYERVVVLSNPDSTYDYPEGWIRPTRGGDELTQNIDAQTVVLVDRIELSRKTLASIGAKSPRILAFAPLNVEQEKFLRRTLRSVYPWAEVWETSTAIGKVLFTKDATGKGYDRDTMLDMRSTGDA